MSRDRFAEMQASQKQFRLRPAELESGAPGPAAVGSGGSAQTDAFFEEVNIIQDAVGLMREDVGRIEALHARQLQSSGPDGDVQVSQECDQLVSTTSKQIKAIKNRLQKLEAATENPTASIAAGDLQMRRSQAAALRRKFLDAATQYQKVEQTHRQRIRERMERQYKVVNPNATREEIDAVLDGSANVFAQDVLGSGRKGEARRALQEVQDRHEDVQKIERTIMELAQLFQEMATMVEQQGDMLDSIEKSVGNATAYTEETVVHLEKAIEHRQASRKKLWILTGIVAVLLIICGVMIYLYLIKPAMAVIPSSGSDSTKSAVAAEPRATAAKAKAKDKKTVQVDTAELW